MRLQLDRLTAVLSAAVILSSLCVNGAVLAPTWDGDVDTTRTVYSFGSNENPAVPDSATFSNPYGTPSSLINTGTFGEGWQIDTDLNIDETGYWGIDDTGFMVFTVPFAESGDGPYTVEFMLDVIGYQDSFLNGLPLLSLESDVVSENIDTYDLLIQPDQWGNWSHQVMTGTVTVASSSSLEFKLQAPTGRSTPIQNVAIYTRAIPEPAAISLILAASGALLFLRRRFGVNND
jgi:hypothetical protein